MTVALVVVPVPALGREPVAVAGSLSGMAVAAAGSACSRPCLMLARFLLRP
jgi:hypothetical protein